MKKRLMKALSIILTVMMLVGVVPMGAMTAFAADVKEAAPEVKATVTEAADKAGEAVKNGAETVKDGAKSLYNSAVTAVSNGVDAVQTAIETKTSGDYEYIVLEDGTAEITKYTGSATNLTIPSELDGYKVTGIGGYIDNSNYYNGAFEYSSLVSVTIPDGVTYIGDSVFYYSYGITKMTIPDSVTYIGEWAFSNCWALIDITIPDSVTYIGDYAFDNCRELADITIPDGVTTINKGTFRGCLALTDITISNSVTSIGEYAFNDCFCLTNVIIPNSVTAIKNGAFLGCKSLTDIKIPNSVISIEYLVFGECISLTDIYVDPQNTKYSSENGVLFSKDKTILLVCPAGNKRESYTIPSSVTKIDGGAFYSCGLLTNIIIPNSVTYIEGSSFEYCSSLTDITIPNSVDYIGSYAFYGCSSLVNITLPNDIKSIGERTFYECSSLTNIAIPNGVISIGNESFFGCSSLENITLPNSIESIGEETFYECGSLANVTIPDSVTFIGKRAFIRCSSLTDVSISNSLMSIEESTFSGCSSLTKVIIPNSVVSIGNRAFADCSSLTNVKMSNSVTSIESYAFLGCSSLTNITIPDSVDYIGYRAFTDCIALTNINVDLENKAYSSEDGVLFTKDKTKLIQYPLGNKRERYVVPNGITTIGEYSFEKCSSITTLTLPVSISDIEYSAFYNCTSLTDVYYWGTNAEWNLIKIGYANNSLLDANIISLMDAPFTLSDEAIILNVGETYQVDAFLGSMKVESDVTWSNKFYEELFSVSEDGKVTAIAEGKGTLWVDFLDMTQGATCKVYIGAPNEFSCDVKSDEVICYEDKAFSSSRYSEADSIAIWCSYGNKIDEDISGRVDMNKFGKYFTDIPSYRFTATISGNDLSFSEDKYINTITAEHEAMKPGDMEEGDIYLYPHNFSLSSGGNTYTLTLKFESPAFGVITKTCKFSVKNKKDFTKYFRDTLEIVYSKGDSASNVTKDIFLKTNNPYGITIKWRSSNKKIVDSNGIVTRPKHDTPVTIYAYVCYEDTFIGIFNSYQKKFKIIVKGTEEEAQKPPVNNDYVQVKKMTAKEAESYLKLITEHLGYKNVKKQLPEFYKLLQGKLSYQPEYEEQIKIAFIEFTYICINTRVKQAEYKLDYSVTMLTKWLDSKGGEGAVIDDEVNAAVGVVKDCLKRSAIILNDYEIPDLPDIEGNINKFVDWSFTITNAVGGFVSARDKAEMQYLSSYLLNRDIENLGWALDYLASYNGISKESQKELNKFGEYVCQLERSLGRSYKKTYKAACPVTMKVYDGAGNLLAVLDNTEEGSLVNPYGSFSVIQEPGTDNFIKTARLYSDDGYVEIKGVGTGNMNLTVEEIDENGESKYFSADVPITENTEMTVIPGEETPEIVVEDETDDAMVSVIEVPEITVKKRTVSATSTNGGFVLGTGEFELGSEVSLSAYSKTGYEFVGWYKNGEFVQSERDLTFVLTEDCEYNAVFELIIDVDGITLDRETAEVTVGDSFKLTATVTPDNATDKTVTWTTSDANVTTVDENGNVTAVGAGTAVITATTANGLTATCTVTVKEPVIDVDGITLDRETAEVTVGDSFSLTATVTPDNATDKTVTWTTSDANVATVDENGNVTAVGAGTAVITATTANGLTATCTVTVKEPVIEVDGITLDRETAEVTVGENFTLTATVTPDNATDKTVTWTSSDVNVATVDKNGNVTAVGAGTAVITATTSNGLTATCTVTVNEPIPETPATLKITSGGQEVGDVYYVKLPNVFMQYKQHSTTLGFEFDKDVDVASVKWSYANWSAGNPEANIENPDSPTTVIRPNGRGIGARSTWITLTVTDTDGNVYQDTVKVRFYKWSWQVH